MDGKRSNDIIPNRVRIYKTPLDNPDKNRCIRHQQYFYSICATCVQEEILKQLIILRKKVDLIAFDGNLAPTESGKPQKTPDLAPGV